MDRIDLVDRVDLLFCHIYEPIPATLEDTTNPLYGLSDLQFYQRYRMDKGNIVNFWNLIKDDFVVERRRDTTISSMHQLMIALRFYASGSFQINVGDLLNVSQSSVSKIIKKVSRIIAAKRHLFINMPENEQKLRQQQLDFYNIRRFPRVYGAIDCVHIKLLRPPGDYAELFRNRKQFFSINTQVIGNANLQICNIVARYVNTLHYINCLSNE